MRDLSVVVLAAGKGKRMISKVPKVLHPVLFKPMIHYVLDVAKALKPVRTLVVVGHGEDAVRAQCSEYADVEFVTQTEQLGTGHAVLQAAGKMRDFSGKVLVLCADVPLLQRESLDKLLDVHGENGHSGTVLTARLERPGSYGRILRGAQGEVTAIREALDCTEKEQQIQEVNSGIYAFDWKSLAESLPKLGTGNRQGEIYLTDVIENLVSLDRKVGAVTLTDPLEMSGINDRVALSEVESHLQKRVNEAWMRSGVTLHGPDSIWIDTATKIGPDTVIEPDTTIISSQIDSGVHIKRGSYLEKSKVGSGSVVGPYAHLRPQTVLGASVKIGNFVEVKNSTLGSGVKASHLSYIGDAEVGENSNLGCGFITCNFDGVEKHKTIIEEDVFIGSDSQTVAPVVIEKGAYIASGSTITDKVPAGALALSRGRQVTKPGYAARYKKP